MNNKIPWERIIKELKQEISLDEQADLDRWKAVENNRALYEEFVQLWNTLMFERMTQPSRADKCWEKMEKRLAGTKSREIRFPANKFRCMAVAASLLLILLLSVTGYVTNQWIRSNHVVQTYASYNGKSKVVLPDGTTVWLHKETTLEYSSSVWSNQRKVRLNGEACFNVTKDKSRPFIVQSHGVDVKVYGTVFNVDARKDKEDVSVSLISGSVEVATANETKLIVPGEEATCAKNTGQIEVEKTDVAFEALWAQESIRFEKKSIKELSGYLSRWYDVKIILDPSIPESQAYTFTIKGEPFEEILRLMARINPIEYHYTEDETVIITPKK